VSILGNRVLRKEDGRFLRGRGEYVENLVLDGALTVTFVRSPLAHARIEGVDASAAAELPGIQVFAGADVDVGPFGPPPFPGLEMGMSRPLVARDRVRFVGDIVAVVVSEDRAAGADAAELVEVEYDPLPAVVALEDAGRDEVLLFPEVGTNVAGRAGSPERDDALFDGCDVVVEGTVLSQRLAPCPLEPRSAAAEVGEDGRLTAWLCTQTPHQDRMVLAGMLGLDPPQVRVIAPDVGGGFGSKMLAVEEILVGWLARRTGRPVRWTESRSESMVALGHGRAQRLEFRLGGTSDGKALAYRLDVLQDAGAYPGVGAFLPHLTHLMASGVYAIPRIEFSSRSVVTTTTPTMPFRGAGRPEATQAVERAMDAFAAETGLDPAEVRRRNLIPRDAFPHQTASGANYDSGDYRGALELALRAVGYDELRAAQKRRREQGGPAQLGIGISTYVEITNGLNETELGEVEITPEGEAILRTGSFSHGQGHETTFAMIAAERLPVEKVRVVKGDTDEVATGTGTYGSKSTQIGGSAARLAADDVVERARNLVADYLEASVDDVVLDDAHGRFHVAGAPEPSLSWADLAGRAATEGRLEELKATQNYQAAPTFPFGAHVAVVEVDTDTGHVELQRLVAVDDAGTLVNPLVAEGQVHGGVATGAAQALYEEVVYDADGNPLTATFADYAVLSPTEVPSFELADMATPTSYNPLGAKGIGEAGTIGATPAVQNAIIDALGHLGVRHIDMPATPQRVWQTLRSASGAAPAGPDEPGDA
jgi:carbon-monoxide dehydrogenase large subunit